MDRFKLFLTVALIGSAIYWAKNIKITVTGAKAVAVEDETKDYDSEKYTDNEDLQVSIVSPVDTPKPINPIKPQVLDHEKTMVRLLKAHQLCEFLSYVKTHGISKSNQYKALGISLGEPFRELHVFAGARYDQFDEFETEMAKAFLLGKKINAFEPIVHKTNLDMDKGLSAEHKEVLRQIDQLQSMNPGNLLYAMFRIDIFLHYKNLNEDSKEPLYRRVMNSNRYANPVYDVMAKLYLQSKNNVAQFYLAHAILEQNSSIQRRLIEHTVWRLYDEGMREHVNTILQKYVDNIESSAKSFGYEASVYKGHRHILPFEIYEVTPTLTQFEESQTQPTYLLSDLKVELGEKCDPAKVNDLVIKLRAL